MITSLTTTSLVHGSASSSSLPVSVKIAAGGNWPVYPSILGWPCASVLMMRRAQLGRDSLAVGLQTVDDLLRGFGADAGQGGRLFLKHPRPVGLAHRDLAQQRGVGLLAGFGHRFEEYVAGLLIGLHLGIGHAGVGVEMPDVEDPHPLQTVDVPTVTGNRSHHRLAAVLAAQANLPSGDIDARNQTLEIEFPRAERGLVKVVQIDNDVALRGSVQAEVGDVRVAVNDDVNPACGSVRQVPGR